MNYRDLLKRPYSEDEKRVGAYLDAMTDNTVGWGDDPIGFLISSHAYSRREIEKYLTQSVLLRRVEDAARQCIWDTRISTTGGDVGFNMGGHRRIRLADALRDWATYLST